MSLVALPMPDRAGDAIARLIDDFTARQPIRTGSLIVTVFGDVVLPRGGALLLGDLIGLLAAFSLNDGQVRTAVSRLVAEGWLLGERLGRRSLYRLTEIGRHRFEEATRRIYFGPPRQWRGDWHVIVLPRGDAAQLDGLRKDLGWLGFGTLAPGVMLHPAPDPLSLASVIDDLPPEARPLVIAGASGAAVLPTTLQALVNQCWDFGSLTEAYRLFLAAFAPLRGALRSEPVIEPLPALLARLMLIHDYRRLVLRDPMLPPALLPSGWIGGDAYALARDIHQAVTPAAERWVDRNLHDDRGPLPLPEPAFYLRFT
jgi:phenylacetic acid degradation operon negative regulatory protein